MVFIPDEFLDGLISEDMPYFDLTTHLLGISGKEGTIRYVCREEAVICGTEEAVRILNKLGVEVTNSFPSGTVVKPGEFFLEGYGNAGSLHAGWKICQSLLDNCSAIATKTKRMVDIVHSVNPKMPVVTTRKSFPGIKALTLKAVLCGGAFPHRLGLSETVLIFKQHMNFIGGIDGLIERIPAIKEHSCEKKVFVEAESMEEAIALCKAGVDGIQFDKLPPEVLSEGVPQLQEISPSVTLLASGGINETNAALYAVTGVDALVTTSLFTAKPIDIGAKIERA
ncbi:nicotinate-nucleotide pyrophosphorylase [Oxobacter pfennigii]|uniref:Putative pyrophosphorylase ModD n=1 Tax=Oxobacter pfennigii TaxID=36849 RepID=A0A0P8W5J3_9CLOT|nr:ModD protein [Oxobacter pfennigii]KPU42916.1 nicotinate-nucleotide pyrophosphorylase [Oxobacter pfennigii]